MSAFPDFHRYDAVGLAELVKRGEVQPSELVEESIARIESQQPRLNFMTRTMFDQAREQVTFYRVAYDAMAAAEQIRRCGLPASLAYRVELGI